jgi:hypothetical protein
MHSHMTRDIRPPGSGCPACDAYWARQGVPPLPEPPLRRGLAADQVITDEVLTEDEAGCE